MAADDEKRVLPGRLPDTEPEFPPQRKVSERHHRHTDQLHPRARPQRQEPAPGDEPRPPRLQSGRQPRRPLRLPRRLHHTARPGQGDIPRGRAIRLTPARRHRQRRPRRPICIRGAVRQHPDGRTPVCRQKQIYPHRRVPGIGRLADTPRRHERAPRLGGGHRRRRHPHRKLRLYRRLRHGHRHHHQPEHNRLRAKRIGDTRESVTLLHAAQDTARARHAVPVQQRPQRRRHSAPLLREGSHRESQHRRRDCQQHHGGLQPELQQRLHVAHQPAQPHPHRHRHTALPHQPHGRVGQAAAPRPKIRLQQGLVICRRLRVDTDRHRPALPICLDTGLHPIRPRQRRPLPRGRPEQQCRLRQKPRPAQLVLHRPHVYLAQLLPRPGIHQERPRPALQSIRARSHQLRDIPRPRAQLRRVEHHTDPQPQLLPHRARPLQPRRRQYRRPGRPAQPRAPLGRHNAPARQYQLRAEQHRVRAILAHEPLPRPSQPQLRRRRPLPQLRRGERGHTQRRPQELRKRHTRRRQRPVSPADRVGTRKLAKLAHILI